MSLLLLKFDAYTRPLSCPSAAAAYTVIENKDSSKKRVLFRLKKTDEANALVSLINARKEVQSQTWHPVSPVPWAQNTGGVAGDSSSYQYVDFVKKDDAWLLVGKDMVAFATANNRTNIQGVELPAGQNINIQDIQRDMDKLEKTVKGK
jgi:hypothetical protein